MSVHYTSTLAVPTGVAPQDGSTGLRVRMFRQGRPTHRHRQADASGWNHDSHCLGQVGSGWSGSLHVLTLVQILCSCTCTLLTTHGTYLATSTLCGSRARQAGLNLTRKAPVDSISMTIPLERPAIHPPSSAKPCPAGHSNSSRPDGLDVLHARPCTPSRGGAFARGKRPISCSSSPSCGARVLAPIPRREQTGSGGPYLTATAGHSFRATSGREPWWGETVGRSRVSSILEDHINPSWPTAARSWDTMTPERHGAEIMAASSLNSVRCQEATDPGGQVLGSVV